MRRAEAQLEIRMIEHDIAKFQQTQQQITLRFRQAIDLLSREGQVEWSTSHAELDARRDVR